MEVTGYETRETSKERSIVLVLMWKRTITWSDLQSNMADGVDFFDGVDLEAILDILEADEEMEEESINEVENVSTKTLWLLIIVETESGKWHRNQSTWIRTYNINSRNLNSLNLAQLSN